MSKETSNVGDIQAARRKKAGERLRDWERLYEQLNPDERNWVFAMFGYEVSPTGELVWRELAIELGEDLWAWLSRQATNPGHAPEEEAVAIFEAELRRLAEEAAHGL